MGETIISFSAEEQYEWDFSITSAITFTFILLYSVQCVRLSFTSAQKRHRLTMPIYYSILANLLAQEMRNLLQLIINMYELDKPDAECLTYAFNSLACVFWSLAVMFNIFEWDLLGSLITHQKSLALTQLDVYKSDFNARERSKTKCFKLSVVLMVLYHIAKITYPLTSIYSCKHVVYTIEECEQLTTNRVDLCLKVDFIFCGILFSYALYAFIKLRIQAEKSCYYEYQRHKVMMHLNGIGILLSLPITLLDLYF